MNSFAFLYPYFLSLHLISVISWMAGILYLIRLFVYHAAETEEVVKTRFRVMERKLYRFITFPAMIAAFIFGLGITVISPYTWQMKWFQVKFALVLGLMGATLYCGRLVKQFAKGPTKHSEKFYRIFNEVPTLLMIAIVFLVIFKAF